MEYTELSIICNNFTQNILRRDAKKDTQRTQNEYNTTNNTLQPLREPSASPREKNTQRSKDTRRTQNESNLTNNTLQPLRKTSASLREKITQRSKDTRRTQNEYNTTNNTLRPLRKPSASPRENENKNKLWRITLDTNPEDCNLHCIMCEEHSPYSDFKQKLFETTGVKFRRMKFEVVERIFDEAAKLGVKEIIPSTMGEPLLYKDIERIFELSQKHNIKINLTTNGTFPKKSVEEWAEIIIPNTTDIKISWNGATAETSEKIMTGSNFHKTLENTKKLVAFRNAHFVETGYFCRITFQLTFMQNNMHELADIVKLAAEIGIDRIKGHHLWTHFAEIENLSMKATQESVSKWNKYVKQAYAAQEKYRKPNGDKVLLENILPLADNEKTEVPESYQCPFLERELWISATGKISPCCAPDNLRQSLGDFGNIETTTVAEVLQSNAYYNLVENYKNMELCKSCNMRKPLN